ncbi:GNAT family N-acetyltransferase [Halanaerobiaceae bacterium Z-7014]|uniref:GNAT family N-acetyltransferase n=1 Tax=Halonatronomonas betaini TaxID=2778430 RepID=A0A931ASG9_9FIRM|nr:GNAT family N-acetyltransferase [Halonatronomonas betaini]MBF8437314.1 GNAT family N-acetyltransferase [Halonatronomonas betaini]
MAVNYRELKKEDYPGVKKLINDLEKFDQIIPDAYYVEKFLSLYLRKTLAESSYCQVAVYDGEVVGLIFASAENDKKCYNPITNSIRAFLDFFKLFISRFEYRELLKAYKEGIFDKYDELLADREDRYQGEIKLFIVSPDQQGLHIGTGLLERAFEYFREQEASRIYLFTDTDCNYGYYDHKGFLQAGTKESVLKLPDGARDLTIFLYEYDL